MHADIQTDIMDWDYKEAYDPHEFDIIWASPPCTEYSRAKTTGVRQIDEANQVAIRTMEIIRYLNPKYWIIENPQTGLLKEQSFMTDIPYKDTDYCKYGLPYRKRTRLWNNIEVWTPRPLCNKNCDSMDGNRHKEVAQRGPRKGDDNSKHSQQELYRVPGLLVHEIFTAILENNS